MYSPGAPPMPMMPPPNFCSPQGYGNVPFPPPFAPYYPPACNYYNNQTPVPFNSPTKGNGSQMPNNFNPAPSMPLYSQPPPGYGVNGAKMSQNLGTNGTVPSFQPVHMANVCSPSFNGFSASSAVSANQFNRPPPTIPQTFNGPKQERGRFSRNDNRRNFDAKNSPYFCEACDRGFPTLNKFKLHQSEHTTCGAEGCTFTAHVKVVEKHFIMQHQTGLFNRIVKGTSPEEIQKWIAERKKHFPTKEKIEVKQAQKEEMKKRGERYAERKRQIHERNEKFKSGSNNRFNRSTPNNRNGRFGSKNFTNRRNSTRDFTKREPVKVEDDDCVLRNILPFKGTAFYLNIKNEPKQRSVEHLISDDEDDYTVLSSDEDVVVIDNSSVTKRNVISELEKSCETSRAPEDSEEDCLDRYFKNCDTVNENDEKIEKRDKPDKDTNITKSTTDDTKLPNDPPVTKNHSVSPDPEISKPVSKGFGSLALIQCYDSESDYNDEDDIAEQSNSKVSAAALIEPELQNNDSSEERKSDADQSRITPFEESKEENADDCSDDSEPNECSSKSVPSKERKSDSDPSKTTSVGEGNREKIDDLSDDSGPDECSSKYISSTESKSDEDQSKIASIEPSKPDKIDDSNDDSGPEECSSKLVPNRTDVSNEDKIEPVASSSTSAIGKETDKDGESKRRKRKRRRDSKGEIEGNEETEKKPEEKLPPPVLHRRKRYRPPTLLEKLLSNEIKHERNVILQCIRYVVEKDYFQVGKSDSS